MENIFSNIKNVFDFGRSQEKLIFQQIKRLLKNTKVIIEYTNAKSDKRLPHDFKISAGAKTITLDVETTPLTSNWHKNWNLKGTCEEVLNRGLRMPLRKFNKLSGGQHLYLKLSPDRKSFFCFVFPEINKHLQTGEPDRKNTASHVKPFNNEFKVILWKEQNTVGGSLIVDDFPALKNKIVEMLKK